MDNEISFQIWDVGGQQIFQNIRPTYYKGALGALILFDVTNLSTLAHCTDWYEEIHQTLQNIPIYLVGNKIDLPYAKADFEMRAKSLATRYSMNLRWTSAKTGDGMNVVFEAIAEDIIKGLMSVESGQATC